MIFTNLRPYCVNEGRVDPIPNGFRLTLPPTSAAAYSNAQLDDYQVGGRFHFQHVAPCRLALQARFSRQAMTGTSGFGFWNHPFGQNGEVLAPPCNVWFFNASRESDMRTVRGVAGWGFKAATLDSSAAMPGLQNPRFFSLISRVLNPLLRLPMFSRPLMASAQAMVRANEIVLDNDWTAWHQFEVDWQMGDTRFFVDGREVLRCNRAPRGPLGLVIWLDNYRAVASNGNYEFGYVACKEEQWIEVKFEQ